MKRREFIAGIGIAVAWPVVARAQQSERMRRIGVLMPYAERDPVAEAYLSGFIRGLTDLGWTDGRNVRIDYRWAAGSLDRMRASAKELADLQPDVIVVQSIPVTRAVQQQTRTIPIVFVAVGDPVANGLVGSLSRPDSNTTGVTNLFPSVAGKWLELLKEASPHIARAALLFNPEIVDRNYLPAIEAAATQYAVTTVRIPIRDASEIERAIESFAAEPNGSLIVVPPLVGPDQEWVSRLALRHRLPAIYANRVYAVEGGLMSYGPDLADLFRRGGASYVDRILRGAKPGDLPVQFPTKFELVVNLKTAKAIGLTIPEIFLLRADEVIE
jgi:putative ABC transport system substrate-binding protein